VRGVQFYKLLTSFVNKFGMAEEKKPDTHPLEPIVILLLIVFIGRLLLGVPALLEDRFGLSFGNLGRILTGKVLILPLEKPVSINDEVITNKETSVYSNPGDEESSFKVAKGVLGKIIDGPIVIDGETWWEVEFEDGSRGWVRENDLGTPGESSLSKFFSGIVPKLKVFAVFASLIVLTLLIYTFIRLKRVQTEENQKFNNYYEPPEESTLENQSWKKVLELADSENPSNWRQAIIDADTILNEALGSKGYMGDGVGDRLKGVDPNAFTTLDYAWEAHKVRNRIAHDGGDFVLTEREAKRVLGLYEAVLREFNHL
jgi:hypothetical protein